MVYSDFKLRNAVQRLKFYLESRMLRLDGTIEEEWQLRVETTVAQLREATLFKQISTKCDTRVRMDADCNQGYS